MQQTKLHILLSALSIYELNKFQKFILSPYHNEDGRLVKLYAFLLPFYKAGKADTIDRAKLWRKVSPARPFTNQHFARLLSDLLKKLESFLAIERMRQQQTDENYYILDTYTEMRLGKHFTEPYLHAVRILGSLPYRDSDYFFHSFRLNSQRNMFLENKRERTTEKYLIETVESLDKYYLINKLRYCAAILHYKHFLSLKDETLLLPEILGYFRLHPPVDTPAVDIYYHIILTIIEPEEEAYFVRLKELLFTHMDLFQTETQREIFTFALQYCIRKVNKGQAAYQAEIFTLYKDALRRDLLLEEGQLTPWDFKNVVTIALRNKDYKWTDSFIETYKIKLPKAERENAYTFNRARYFFAIKKYDAVLQLLQSVEYNDIFYLLDSKTTLMKTYYELGEYQPLQSLKESFRILLRRKKLISDQNKVNYGNFARYAMKLFRSDVKDKKQMATLRREIEKTNNIADKSWLIEKLDEINPV